MLWRMEVFAGWLVSVASPLNTVVARGDFSTLHFDGRPWMSKLAFEVWPGAFVALELPADFKLKPPGVLPIVVKFGQLSKVRILPLRWQAPPPLKLAPTSS